MMMHIDYGNWFWPLLLLFLIWAGFSIYTFWRDRRDLEILGYQNFVLSPHVIWIRRVLKGSLILGGFLVILLGAVRLQGKPLPEDLDLRGVDVMIVLDLSKSMMTQDMVPNRLEAAKRYLLSWLQNQDGDRVGLTVFAGEALVQVPLTFDLQAVSLVLDRDDVDVVEKGGTDIGEGIRTALASFSKDDQNKRGKAILLLTDGEITDGASNLTEACLEAKEKKVPIIAVGMGTRQGRPIPDGVSFWGEPVYKKDGSGSIHISQLDEKTLEKIAEMTGGAFIHGDNEEGMASIQKALDGLQKTEMKGQGAMRRQELSPFLGKLAVAVLLLSFLI
jgi:Ca-activated chloride channel homolog